MQVLSNAGGGQIRPKLQDVATAPPACRSAGGTTPRSWPTASSPACPTTRPSSGWCRTTGSSPTALTPPTAAGSGRIDDAWLVDQKTYVAWQTSRDVPGRPTPRYGRHHIGPLGQARRTPASRFRRHQQLQHHRRQARATDYWCWPRRSAREHRRCSGSARRTVLPDRPDGAERQVGVSRPCRSATGRPPSAAASKVRCSAIS